MHHQIAPSSIVRRFRIAGPVVVAALFGTAHAAAAQSPSVCDAVAGNLVVNCGFESGSFGGWTAVGDNANSGVDAFSARSGAYGAYFANRGPLTLTQLLSTVAGARYTVRFSLLSEDNPIPGTAFFRASLDGTQLFDLETQAPLAYTSYSLTGVATGATTQLQFVLENAPSFYQLDDVSVAATTTPEPASVALIGGGLLALGTAAHRRRTA